MGMDGTGLSVADAIALRDDRRNYNDGFFGDGNGSWILFLFFIMALGGGYGWSGNGWGGNGAGNQINNDFLYTNLRADMNHEFNQIENGIRNVQNGLCDGFYAQNTTMLQGFNGVDKSLCCGFNDVNTNILQARFDAQQCCCETNRNIDALRYENAKNTCDIINSGERNTQRIIDHLTQSEIQTLRDNLQTANFQLSQQAQSANLIDQLRPCPIPAYLACSPYESFYPFGNRAYGYNGCGCNSCC